MDNTFCWWDYYECVLLIIMLCDVLIDSGHSFLLKVRWTIYLCWGDYYCIVLQCSCFIMTCTLSHEPYHPVWWAFHVICPSIGTNWPLLSWSIGSWISDYMCKQCLSPLTLWAWIPLMARCTRYNFLWYNCFSELQQDDSLLRVLRFLQTIKLIDRI